MKPVRFGISVAITVVIVAGILLIPTPHYVRCSFIVQHRDAASVYVEIPGIVDSIHVRESQQVQPGQTLLTLANPELIEGITLLEGEEQIARQRYLSTKQQSHYAEAAEADVEAQMVSWQAITRQLEQRRESMKRLQVAAPIAGRVISASFVAEQDDEDGDLKEWHGHPLEPRNQGAFLEQGTVVCQVAPHDTSLEAILAIDQADIEFITNGNPVELWIRQTPDELYSASIDLISPVEMRNVPRALSSLSGGPLISIKGPDGKDVPHSTTYQVRVPIVHDQAIIGAGSTGMARIRTGNQTIGSRLWRFACKTFRFDL